MLFAYTIVYVSDVEATLSFYENAFGFTRRFITEEKDYGELATGSTVLSFASESMAEYNKLAIIKNTPDAPEAPGIELAFATEDPAKAFQDALTHGATEVVPLTEKPWGQTVGYVRDINGVLIEICTPMQAPA